MNIEKVNKRLFNGWAIDDKLVVSKRVELNKDMKSYLMCKFMYSESKKQGKILLRISYYRISNKRVIKGSVKSFATQCKKPILFKKRGIINILRSTTMLLDDSKIIDIYKNIKTKR